MYQLFLLWPTEILLWIVILLWANEVLLWPLNQGDGLFSITIILWALGPNVWGLILLLWLLMY